MSLRYNYINLISSFPGRAFCAFEVFAGTSKTMGLSCYPSAALDQYIVICPVLLWWHHQLSATGNNVYPITLAIWYYIYCKTTLLWFYIKNAKYMCMMSRHGNAFRVSGLLCRKPTSYKMPIIRNFGDFFVGSRHKLFTAWYLLNHLQLGWCGWNHIRPDTQNIPWNLYTVWFCFVLFFVLTYSCGLPRWTADGFASLCLSVVWYKSIDLYQTTDKRNKARTVGIILEMFYSIHLSLRFPLS